MNTVLKKYGAGIFAFIILVLTAMQGVEVWNLVTGLQFAALVLSSILSVGVFNLLPKGWAGGLKTGVDLLGTIIALVLPYAVSGHIDRSEIILVVIGFLKAAATEFGVIIRVDNVIPAVGAGTKEDPAVVTSLVADVKAVNAGPETPGTVINPPSQ